MRGAVRDVETPVVVSGLGSSGTRVAARMCGGLGIDMGGDLNRASDNLLFTLLFKRPLWLTAAGLSAPSRDVDEVLELFTDLSTQQHAGRSPARQLRLMRIAGYQVRAGIERGSVARRAVWAARRLAAAARPLAPAPAGWGWKEPTTHLYLEHLVRRFPRMRYVHMVRDPADYALATHNQLPLWGPLLGVDPPRLQAEVLPRQLEYWAVANLRAVDVVRRAGVAHLVLRLEDLCADPDEGVRELARFLGAPLTDERLEQLAALVRPPVSLGRGGGVDVRGLLGARCDEVRSVLRYAV